MGPGQRSRIHRSLGEKPIHPSRGPIRSPQGLNDRHLAPVCGVGWVKEVAVERARAKPKATPVPSRSYGTSATEAARFPAAIGRASHVEAPAVVVMGSLTGDAAHDLFP